MELDVAACVRPRHKVAVPGLGVFIAPGNVARLFSLHDYTRCVRLDGRAGGSPRVLYPILRPNVLQCPRYYRLQQATRQKRKFWKDCVLRRL